MNNVLSNIKQLVILLGLILSSSGFAVKSDLKSVFKAIKQNKQDAVQEFIKTNDVNQVSAKKKWTPLLCACYYDNYDAVKVLIAAGADVNYISPKKQRTLLQIAAEHCRLVVVKELRKNGADIREGDHFSKECKPISDYLKEEKEKQYIR
jgi:ankyrin repeat protein